MTPTNEATKSLLNSSILGIVRGIAVHTFIYPLEVIKTHQQNHQKQSKSHQIAMHLLRKEGLNVFYRGLSPQLVKTSIKQVWCWPMITGIPRFLDRYSVNSFHQQVITGLGIATVDAAITTPLERAKILSIVRNKTPFFRDIYKAGWYGFTTHWTKLSINWSTFLVAQKYFRDQYRDKSAEQVLTLSQLTSIGVQVAFIVSLTSAPFDVANTLKQSKNLNVISYFFSGNILRKTYRGWPLSALSLVIHNIASVILIDKLGQINKN